MTNSQTYLADLGRKVASISVDAAGLITAVGEAAVEEIGLAAEALVGRPLDEVLPVHSNDGQEIRCLAGESTLPSPRRFHSVSLNADGGASLVLLLEITELLRARSECIRLSRLASAGRMISSIVHEINNPLSGIIGYSQLLLMRELDRDSRGAVEKIYGEALRTTRIIRNLLDLSRRRNTTQGKVRLGRVLRKALELKGHDLRVKNISVHLDVSDALPAVHGDQHQLLQVFVNLISNSEHAMYASDKGGRVTLEAHAGKETVTLLLRDTGPGIPEHLRDKVFEPFFTTKGEGEGTGLGLALCREILHQQRATIQLLQSSDAGAAFVLTFPIHSADEVETPRSRGARRRIRVRDRRVVVVEDDPVCRAMVAEAFESSGNTVRAFDRSEPALRFLRSHVADVIISDIQRPGLNGMEFHRRVYQFDRHLAGRILFLTGDTLNDDLVAFLKRTGNPYVLKPVLLNDLFEAVEKLLAGPTRGQKTLFSADDLERREEQPN